LTASQYSRRLRAGLSSVANIQNGTHHLRSACVSRNEPAPSQTTENLPRRAWPKAPSLSPIPGGHRRPCSD